MRQTLNNLRRLCSGGLLAIACIATPAGAQQTPQAPQTQRDVLAGHITGPSGPIAGATVTVLAAGAQSDAAPQVARTDVEGRWLVAVQEGTGDYVIRVTAIGMVPARTTAKRGEPRKPIIVDVRMEAAAVARRRAVVEATSSASAASRTVRRSASDRIADRRFAGAIAVADPKCGDGGLGARCDADSRRERWAAGDSRCWSPDQNRVAQRSVLQRRRHSAGSPSPPSRSITT